jgi:tubulin monoglycylase TTLL3/8
MKKALTCALLSVQDTVEDRKASFELFGADFLLTEDLNPWLLEINSSPDLSSSTPITKRLCHSVIEDIIKGECEMCNVKNTCHKRVPCSYHVFRYILLGTEEPA